MEFAAHSSTSSEAVRRRKLRGPPPPRKIPSAKHVKDELEVPRVAKVRSELTRDTPVVPDTGGNNDISPPSSLPGRFKAAKSGRQNDWFSSNDKKRRNSADLGRALLSSGLLDKDTSRKMSVVSLLRKNSTETNVQKAASKWKK